MPENEFALADYCVFATMFAFSAFIGFFYAYRSRHNNNMDEFLLGGRNLNMFPVAMSIMASFTSAISVLGFSQEMYRFGTMYWLIGISYFITQPFAAHVYVPFFHRLNITSAYEYLQMRFNYWVRILASFTFCLQMILYMSVVLYTPSVAIQQVTGISLGMLISVTGIVCTVYTVLGGMKAVIWTDTFQVFVMFAGLIAIIVKGSMLVGGFGEVWNRAKESSRIELFDFDPDPLRRHTFWTLMVGGFFTSLTVYGSNQATIQRYLTMRTVTQAKIAMYINLIACFAILTLTCVTGLIAFAVYYKCDILLSKKITRGEQILPFLVMDLLHDYPGLPGLFVACLYSAALSTISSGLNSLAAVCLKDFIQPFYSENELTDLCATTISRIIAVLFGALTVGLAFLCQYAGTTVLQISLSIFGILGGPLLGVISLGMFCRVANSKGALVGFLLSLVVNLWIGIGGVLYGKVPIQKPMSIEECSSNETIISLTYYYNSTNSTVSPLNVNSVDSSFHFVDIYRLSYLWYSALSVLIVFVVGISVSLCTGRFDSEMIDERLFINYNELFGFGCNLFNEKEKRRKRLLKSIGQYYYNNNAFAMSETSLDINPSKRKLKYKDEHIVYF